MLHYSYTITLHAEQSMLILFLSRESSPFKAHVMLACYVSHFMRPSLHSERNSLFSAEIIIP